jgi:Zn-dependent peptidase ImmA (M78 family)/lambda repressor-like predicted transcriptional regulator
LRISEPAIAQILEARGLSLRSLARRIGISISAFEAAVEGEGELQDEDIRAVADELAVPVTALFSQQNFDLVPSVDFRSPTPGSARLDPGTIEAFGYVERLSNTLGRLGLDLSLGRSASPIQTDLSSASAVKLASLWRAKWAYSTEQQLEDRDANKVYVSLRGFIEALGVMVLHYSFGSTDVSGLYAKVNGGPHTVVINTTGSSKARKLFTLAHEFAHVLLRQEGASNTSIVRNKIERFCNKFAAHLLAPDDLIKAALRRFGYKPSADNNFIRLLAKNLGVSQEATVRRLVEMSYLSADQYGAWRSQFDGITPPGDTTDGAGGKSDPIQAKRTQYGSTLISLLAKAKRTGSLDEIDVYQICGIKPKYQAPLFGEH